MLHRCINISLSNSTRQTQLRSFCEPFFDTFKLQLIVAASTYVRTVLFNDLVLVSVELPAYLQAKIPIEINMSRTRDTTE